MCQGFCTFASGNNNLACTFVGGMMYIRMVYEVSLSQMGLNFGSLLSIVLVNIRNVYIHDILIPKS